MIVTLSIFKGKQTKVPRAVCNNSQTATVKKSQRVWEQEVILATI